MTLSKSTRGFTIIELLVAVAIIAILTAIITTNFTKARANSRDAKRISDIVHLQLALELFFDRCNRFPIKDPETTMPKLVDHATTAERKGCPSDIYLSTFISKLPTSPPPGNYEYRALPENEPTDYVLRAKLENFNTALNDDIDGTVFPNATANLQLDCSDDDQKFYFCVQPR